jgi:hypothetical protein
LECVGTGSPSCDDGNPCTSDSCASPTGCVHELDIETGCNTTNGKASFSVKDSSEAAKDQLKFQWQKGTITLADLGTPTASNDYVLCAFDENGVVASALAPAGSTCGSAPCWTESTKGVKYSDKAKPPTSDGVSQISGTAGSDGKGKLQAKLAGSSMNPLDIASIAYPVKVQLKTSGGECWEQDFDSADEKKNDGAQLKLGHVAP